MPTLSSRYPQLKLTIGRVRLSGWIAILVVSAVALIIGGSLHGAHRARLRVPANE